MDQKLFPGDVTLQEKRDTLESISTNVEKRFYYKSLTEDELQNFKDDLTQCAIKKGAIEEEKKEVMAGFKEKLKPVTEKYANCLDVIKHNGVQTEGNVYLVPNHDEGMMGYYDEDGTLISSRRLLPEEKQNNLFLGNFKQAVNE